MKITPLSIPCLAFALCWASPSIAGNPWADHVVQYEPGTGIGKDWVTGNYIDNPLTALGEPTRYTGDAATFGGPTSPFNAPYRDHEVVTLGAGGTLTLRFDEPVINHPLNPFGIDLLIFGNAFYTLVGDYGPNGVASSAFPDEGGKIEVSANGVHFVTVSGSADRAFPTVGYLDVVDPSTSAAGTVLSDFTKPVDPSFNPTGLNTAQIIAGYNGSGGGFGIDLTSVGLSSITHIRFSNPAGSLTTPEIDAVADVAAVPEPATLGMLAIAAAGMLIRQRR